MRIVRLLLGLIILVQSFFEKDTIMTLVGIVLTVLPVFNLGGCASGQCYTPGMFKRNKSGNDVIQFEEVKKVD